MITPGAARTSASVTAEFTSLDSRANALGEEDIAAGSIRREEFSATSGEKPFTHGILQEVGGDKTLVLGTSDGDKAVSPNTELVLVLFATDAVIPGGADSSKGCHGLLVTWSTYLVHCHTYRGVGDSGWAGATKGPSDSACVIETWLQVRGSTSTFYDLPGTRRYLRAGARQQQMTGSPPAVANRLERAAYITCDGACLITEDRLTDISLDRVSGVRLVGRYVMSHLDYGNITGAGVASPEALLTDSVLTVHVVRNAEMP
jgi:hypothetical protein